MLRLPVFVAELDDDYQLLAGLKPTDLLARIRCYYLLAPSLLLHPAYVWQSDATHSLVTSQRSKILTPPFTQVALGDSPDFSEYMHQRISTLTPKKRGGNGPTDELRQYQRWGGLLTREASLLDTRFSDAQKITFSESRDKMFRRLLRRDLTQTVVGGYSLRELIIQWMGAQNGGPAQKVTSSLLGFVSAAPLVSIDSINRFLTGKGLKGLCDGPFRARLLSLYYRANVDDGFVVAGLPTIDPTDPTIHPYDPVLFWAVVGHVFGKEAEATLSSDPSPRVEELLVELKGNDSNWIQFIEQYAALRDEINMALNQEAEVFAKEIETSSAYIRLKVLPRVWREQKKELIATVLGTGFSSLGLMPPSIISIGGLAASITGTVLMIRPLRRFATEYRNNTLRLIKKRVRRELYLLRQG